MFPGSFGALAVNVQCTETLHLDVRVVLRKLGQPSFGFPPVKAIFPVLCETLHFCCRDTKIPQVLVGGLELAREPGPSETLLELFERVIGDGDGVWLDFISHDKDNEL